MGNEKLQTRAEANWLRVDAQLRDRCVWHLRARLGDLPSWQAIFTADEEPKGFHFGSGMDVRNLLRQVVGDDELPPVRYEGGAEYKNWDDYYMAALRQAVLPREGEV